MSRLRWPVIVVSVAALVGASCGYAVGPTEAARFDDAIVGAALWIVIALVVLGLLALDRSSRRFRQFARASGVLTTLCGVAFALLLAETGGGLSSGSSDQWPVALRDLAYAGFILSIVVGVPSLIVWLVIGLPKHLHALPQRPDR